MAWLSTFRTRVILRPVTVAAWQGGAATLEAATSCLCRRGRKRRNMASSRTRRGPTSPSTSGLLVGVEGRREQAEEAGAGPAAAAAAALAGAAAAVAAVAAGAAAAGAAAASKQRGGRAGSTTGSTTRGPRQASPAMAAHTPGRRRALGRRTVSARAAAARQAAPGPRRRRDVRSGRICRPCRLGTSMCLGTSTCLGTATPLGTSTCRTIWEPLRIGPPAGIPRRPPTTGRLRGSSLGQASPASTGSSRMRKSRCAPRTACSPRSSPSSAVPAEAAPVPAAPLPAAARHSSARWWRRRGPKSRRAGRFPEAPASRRAPARPVPNSTSRRPRRSLCAWRVSCPRCPTAAKSPST
mmetsp:Transcript_119450/g.381063  ORF Transcript_119450/g.381063 Transcript_119450/m.381063 type:complete len:353 (-) Transcript_119450:130-1188(-)